MLAEMKILNRVSKSQTCFENLKILVQICKTLTRNCTRWFRLWM